MNQLKSTNEAFIIIDLNTIEMTDECYKLSRNGPAMDRLGSDLSRGDQ